MLDMTHAVRIVYVPGCRRKQTASVIQSVCSSVTAVPTLMIFAQVRMKYYDYAGIIGENLFDYGQ